jgi:hypothetical protein
MEFQAGSQGQRPPPPIIRHHMPVDHLRQGLQRVVQAYNVS